MKIALAGNPNSGKTTLFNALTGKTEYVGNWSGVTVNKMASNLKGKFRVMKEAMVLIDLPGAYSIAPFTEEEAVTRDFILEESPDVIINIVDGANISRSLFFTTQLLELDIPVIIALNKSDVLNRRADEVDLKLFSEILGCPIVPITAKDDKGLEELIQATVDLRGHHQKHKRVSGFDPDNDIARQNFVNELVAKVMKRTHNAHEMKLSDRMDSILAHRWFGLPIFFAVMWAVYAISINGLGGFLSDWLNDVVFGDLIPNGLNGFFESIGVHPLLQALIVDGAIGGVGAVVGFLPLIMVLFFCLALLEDSGYMSRVAVIMDKYFKKIGLSGKSIIPMVVGTGCAVPGVMATRTIEDENQRRITTILTPFVPCSAKLPIIALFSVVFFPKTSWVGPSMYMMAIGVIAVGGLFLKELFVFEDDSLFIIELPEYKLPSLKNAIMQMFDKAKHFIYKAATIILVMNTLVWFMQAYGWDFKPVVDQSDSILAGLGGVLAPLLIPAGIIGWQMAAATVTGFIAKENVVATLSVLLAVASEEALHTTGGVLTTMFTPVTAYAFLALNLFTPPCFAAMGAMNSELGSKKWLFRGLSFQLSVGYIIAMIISQFGTLIFYGRFARGFMSAMFILIGYGLLITFLIHRAKVKRKHYSAIAE